MNYLAEHHALLEQAVAGKLPDKIDESSSTPVWAVRDLVEDGLLRAIDMSADDGLAFHEARVTIAGREYLNELNRRVTEASPSTKFKRIGLRVLDWSGGIVAGIVIAVVSSKVL